MKNLKKGILAGVLAIALVLGVSFIPSPAKASGEKFFLIQTYRADSTHFGASVVVSDGSTIGSPQFDFSFPVATYATEQQYKDAMNTAFVTLANSTWGYSGVVASDLISTYTPNGRTQSSASRSLNTCFQVSAIRDSLVNYSVDIGTTLSLSGGQTGTVFLEIYNDSGCTTGTQELARSVNGNTGTLTIGLNITQNVTAGINGYVPAGKYVKIRTANTTGTPTFNYRSGQEVLY